MAKTRAEMQFENYQLVYKKTAELHQYFLSWRHQLLAGYLAVLAAMAVAFNWAYNISCHSRIWIVIVGIVTILLTILFWLLEIRNRQLYRSCQNVAQNIEQWMGVVSNNADIPNCGVYHELKRFTGNVFNHSSIMDLFFGAIIILLIKLILLTILFLK